MADLLVLPRPAKSVQNGAGFSKKLERTGPAEKERVASVPQREQLARTPELLLPKGKGTELSVQSTRSWRGDSQGGREPHRRERGGSEREHGEEKVDSTVNEGRFQGGKGRQAKRASLEEVQGSIIG